MEREKMRAIYSAASAKRCHFTFLYTKQIEEILCPPIDSDTSWMPDAARVSVWVRSSTAIEYVLC
jgi:hypothetical protein